MLVDTHCHLTFEPLFNDLQHVLQRARQNKVTRIIVPAYDAASWALVREVSEQDGIYAAFGLHPWVAGTPFEVDELERFLDHDKAVAIGEIGLDFKHPQCDRTRQMEVLRLQLDLAVTRELPVLLHCRGAFEELISVLAQYTGRIQGVVHAFSRGPDLARRFIDQGLFLAFGGAITRPRARRPRSSAKVVPLDRVLLETDAPSIGLDGVNPEQVEPHHIMDIALSLALLREVELETIARSTTQNAKELFRFS